MLERFNDRVGHRTARVGKLSVQVVAVAVVSVLLLGISSCRLNELVSPTDLTQQSPIGSDEKPALRPPGPLGQLGQFRSDGATAIVVSGTTDEAVVVFKGTLSDPDAGERVRLQIEVRPAGAAFSGSPSAESGWVASGSTAAITVSGLQDQAAYAWRARTVDEGGLTASWVSFGGNPESAPDFKVALPAPAPPPQPPPPQAPRAPTALGQFKSDGATAIAVGGTTDETSIVLRGTPSDRDAGGQLRLQVELRPVGTAFSGSATAQSGAVANGAAASVTIAGLSDGAQYHWQARSVDEGGRTSAWLSFGGNAESTADFRVALAPLPPPAQPTDPNKPTNLGQFRSDGTTAIAVGGTTDEQTVVFKATVSDPNSGDRIRLEVEAVSPGLLGLLGETIIQRGGEVGSGGVAEVRMSGLTRGRDYYWRARAVDSTGRTSAWVSFGGNADGDADFRVR